MMPSTPPQPSLRRLLLSWLLGPLLILLAIASGGAFYIARSASTGAYDKALLDPIQVLSQHIEMVNNRPVVRMSPESLHSLFTDTYDSMYYQVATNDGLLFAGDLHLSVPARLTSKPRFYNASVEGRKVRVAALRVQLDDNSNSVVIQVAETLTKRDRNLYEILAIMIAPALLMVLAAVMLVAFGIRRGLTPLQKLQTEIAARSMRDLRPVPEHHAPDEVRPLIASLNTLLQNLAAAVDGQQRFMANAAHQLRTPLAGLQTQVEVALRREDMSAELRLIFEQLLIATQRAAHLANQLLVLARAEPGALHLMTMQQLDLAVIIEDMIGLWVSRANSRHIDLGFEITPAPCWGDSLLIGELITNLIDNALRYTLENGYITVRCYQDGGTVLEVEDNGIGIPEALREKVLERFYRVDGSPGNGCGLGLAIVQEISNLHEAKLIIATPEHGRGTRMIVRFPLQVTA